MWLGSKSIQRNDGVKRSWLLAQPVFSAGKFPALVHHRCTAQGPVLSQEGLTEPGTGCAAQLPTV